MSLRITRYDNLFFVDPSKQRLWERHKQIRDIFIEWNETVGAVTSINSESIRSLRLLPNNEVHPLLPQGTKDIYYSFFVHELMRIGWQNDWKVYPVLEALYWMVFTPSPTGWLMGMLLADRNRSYHRNFILKCIDEMREYAPHYSVSAGRIRRRQPSAGSDASVEQVMQSMNNLLSLINLANECDDTKRVRGAFNNGVHKAGPLIATELINVLTKIGLITNTSHIKNVSFCEKNNTTNRLGTLGINSDGLDDLMTYLCREFGLPSAVMENCVCEMLRWRYTSGQFQEAIGGWQHIYTFDIDDNLLAFDVEGNVKQPPSPQWDYSPPADYAGIRWWEENYKSTYSRQLEEVVPLVKRGISKKRKRHA